MIFHLKQCESTNSELRRRFAEGDAAIGSCLWTSEQTRGRGRGSNTWTSPSGGFYFSALVPASRSAPITWTPLRSALWVASILERAGAELLIKWPNDLLSLRGEKFCGILCEGLPAQDSVIVGIGINQNSPGLPATTGLSELGIRLTNSKLAYDLSASMGFWFGKLGPDVATLKREYEKRAAFRPGARVTWRPKHSTTPSEGVIEGLGDWGELILKSGPGSVRLYAEEISGLRQN